MVLFEMLIIATGMLYGYIKPGKENRTALFKKGVLIGVVLALVFVALGGLLGGGFLLLAGGVVGFWVFIEFVILTVLFIAGTFIGDWLEENIKGKAQ